MQSNPARPASQANTAESIIGSATYAGAGAGLVGAAFAAGNATLKGRPVILWSAVAGGQCCALGFTFWLSRQILTGSTLVQNQAATRSFRDDLLYSSISGSLAGMVGGALRGRSNVLPGAIVFGIVGLGGQIGVTSLATAIDAPKERQPLLERLSTSKWWPLQSITDADYEHQLKKQLEALDTEIVMVDNQISTLKQNHRR